MTDYLNPFCGVAATLPHPLIDPATITEPRKRLEYLRDFLRAMPPARFNMEHYKSKQFYDVETRSRVRDGADDHGLNLIEDCGTVGCIAGWAHTLFKLSCPIASDSEVGAALGLNREEAHDLFIPDFLRLHLTNHQAADVIQYYLDHGWINWDKFVPEDSPARIPEYYEEDYIDYGD